MEIIIGIILFVVVFLKINNLSFEIKKLERKISDQTVIDKIQIKIPESAIVSTPINSQKEIIVEEPEIATKFIEWLKEDWLQKLGGLLLLIGLGWFTTYAFINNWINAEGRITLGVLLGIALLILGTFRIKKYLNQGGVFLVLGSTVVLITIFVAQQVYSMFLPSVALTIMFLSAAYVSFVSVKYNSFAIALSGLVLAALAPILAGGSSNDFYTFSYLLIVVIGVMWIVAVKKNWGGLIFASLISVFFYSLPIIVDAKFGTHNGYALLNFAYIFSALFFIGSVINILKSKEEGLVSSLWIAAVNCIFLLVWVMNFAGAAWQSQILFLWAIIFAIGASFLFIKTKNKNAFYIYIGSALVMLAAGTGIKFHGDTLTTVYILEAFLVPILIYLVTKSLEDSSISSVVLIAPFILSMTNLVNYFESKIIFSKDFFVLALIATVLFCLGYIFRIINKDIKLQDFVLDKILIIVSSVYVYVILWITLHIIITVSTTATIFSLIIFTIGGLIKYFYGISAGSKIFRDYGGILLFFVVFRLLFIDIWNMDIGPRIVAFFLIGILLMSTAFITKKIRSGFVGKV